MISFTNPRYYVIQHVDVVHDIEHDERHDDKCQKYSLSSENEVSTINWYSTMKNT